LAKEFGFHHLSIGDLLRNIVQQTNLLDDEISQCVRQGSLLPAKSLAPILEAHIATQKDLGHRVFLIDGFPRNQEQIDPISAVVSKTLPQLTWLIVIQTGKPDLVLFFECPKQLAKVRVLTRNLGNRIDDEDMFETRYTEYCTNNPKIVEYYRKMKILLQVRPH
jgi:adenylate kinase family enzyme